MKNIVVENLANHDFTSELYYVYALLSPGNREPFYIGKGRHHRFQQHLYSYTSKNHHKNHKIARVLQEHGYLLVQILSASQQEQEAYELEKDFIKRLPNLTNLTEGGSDAPSKPARQIVQYDLFGAKVATHLSYFAAGAAVQHLLPSQSVDFTSKQILECCRGATPTCAGFYWAYEGEDIKRKRSKILPVEQLDPRSLNPVARFVSAAEAGRQLGCDGRDIRVAIRKETRCKKFKWRFC